MRFRHEASTCNKQEATSILFSGLRHQAPSTASTPPTSMRVISTRSGPCSCNEAQAHVDRYFVSQATRAGVIAPIKARPLTVTSAQLRLLAVPALHLVPDGIEELLVALLRILGQRRDECLDYQYLASKHSDRWITHIRHGTGRLARFLSIRTLFNQHQYQPLYSFG